MKCVRTRPAGTSKPETREPRFNDLHKGSEIQEIWKKIAPKGRREGHVRPVE